MTIVHAMSVSAAPRLTAVTLALLAAAGCRDDGDAANRVASAPPSHAERALVNAGELQAGGPVRHLVVNPVASDLNAAADGERLYIWFNCAGCHGAKGGGAIGPPLRDAQWIYGSDPASIFQSIAQGRPNGMPAFGGKVPDEQIWRIEMYIRSLGGIDTTVRAGGSSGISPTQKQQARSGG